MKTLKVTTIQSSLAWHEHKTNLNSFSEKINSISESTDLIVLPEMFTTGFSMASEQLAEPMDGPSMHWLKETAKSKNCVVTGSIIIKENNKYFNRLIWMRPDGSFEQYDKRHLFRFANENEHFTAGKEKLIVELNGWRFCPLICFDLRFPVWSRNQEDYDCLLYIANWPEARNTAWKTLLAARAHENQCYVVGVNRVGYDGNNTPYSGDSAVISPKGNIISTTKPYKEQLETVELNLDELNEFRKKFPVALDSDDFIINP